MSIVRVFGTTDELVLNLESILYLKWEASKNRMSIHFDTQTPQVEWLTCEESTFLNLFTRLKNHYNKKETKPEVTFEFTPEEGPEIA